MVACSCCMKRMLLSRFRWYTAACVAMMAYESGQLVMPESEEFVHKNIDVVLHYWWNKGQCPQQLFKTSIQVSSLKIGHKFNCGFIL